VLHEGDTFALDGVRDEDLRARRSVELGEGPPQIGVVVAIARRDVPAERPELCFEVAEREDLVCRPVGLELVAVHDDREVRRCVVRGCL